MNALTAQLYPALLRHAALLLAGHTAAQAMQPADLLHMAVERLCTRPPAEIREHPAEFTGLVRTIMQRTLINEFRKASAIRRPNLSRAALLEEAAGVPEENTMAARFSLMESLSLLASQDADAAELLRLYYLEGRTGAEIAARLCVSTPAISRRLSVALTALRGIYGAGE